MLTGQVLAGLLLRATGRCLQWPDSHGCTESGSLRPVSGRALLSALLALPMHPLPTTPVPAQALARTPLPWLCRDASAVGHWPYST